MNNKILIILTLVQITSTAVVAKNKLPTQVLFSVQAPAKEITGGCTNAQVWIDKKQGKIQASITVDSITFKNNFTSEDMNGVIRERFRTYYMESTNYPNISFTGSFHPDSLRLSVNDSRQPIQIRGTLTIHGISKTIAITAYTDVKKGKRILKATIPVSPGSYGIRIPSYIGRMYFKEVAIHVESILQ